MPTPKESVQIAVPCKLMLAGEWGILEPGNRCIVMAINRYVCVDARRSSQWLINAPDLGIVGVSVSIDNGSLVVTSAITHDRREKLIFVSKACETALRYLGEKGIKTQACELTISTPGLYGQYGKYGLGSSAAVTVAVIKALLIMHGFDCTSDVACLLIFKLSSIAHYVAQGSIGSCFDVAASASQTTVIYRRFDYVWLRDMLMSHGSLAMLVESPWPRLELDLQLPCRPAGSARIGVR